METVVPVIAPIVVAEVVKLLEKLVRGITEEQHEIKQKLFALQMDLNIIKDVSKIIMKNNLRNFDGIDNWMNEASRIVNDATTLIQSIENDDNLQKKRPNPGRFHCSKDDEKQLNELKNRCDQLIKHKDTVFKIIEHNRYCSSQDQSIGKVVVAAIAPEVVAVVTELLKKLLRRTTEEKNEIKQNFVALQIDLNIIKDIAKIIMNNNLRNLDGLKTWMEEASILVNDATMLLQRIEDQNDRPKRRQRNQGRFHCSRDDN